MTSSLRSPPAGLGGAPGGPATRPDPEALTSACGRGWAPDEWNACDKALKSLAHMAVAALVGPRRLDIGYFLAHDDRLDAGKAGEVPRWRRSDAFTPLERDVLEYAEAMSHAPSTVTGALASRLLDALGSAAMVELTAFIGLANLVAWSGTATGTRPQGAAVV